jgi:hypothetical protein
MTLFLMIVPGGRSDSGTWFQPLVPQTSHTCPASGARYRITSDMGRGEAGTGGDASESSGRCSRPSGASPSGGEAKEREEMTSMAKQSDRIVQYIPIRAQDITEARNYPVSTLHLAQAPRLGLGFSFSTPV